jgi:hypothetical protein
MSTVSLLIETEQWHKLLRRADQVGQRVSIEHGKKKPRELPTRSWQAVSSWHVFVAGLTTIEIPTCLLILLRPP